MLQYVHMATQNLPPIDQIAHIYVIIPTEKLSSDSF